MLSFRDLPIRTKMTLLLAGLVVFGVTLVSVGFVVNDVLTLRRGMIEHLSALAEVLGANSAAALDFDDPKQAQRILSSLELEPDAIFACTYNAGGKVFATYERTGTAKVSPPVPQPDGSGFNAEGDLELFRQIRLENRLLGTIHIKASMVSVRIRLLRYALLVTVLLLGFLGLAAVVAYRIQVVISGPILQLANAAKRVSAEADYSIRVPEQGRDELGVLCAGFNMMLTQIQKRDVELAQHRLHLEELVRARTQSLETRTQELAQRRLELEIMNKELESFSYSVSHDLRAPLRAIAGFSRKLVDNHAQNLDEDAKHYLDRVMANALNMSDLIDDLLAFARLGRQAVEKKLVQPKELVASVLAEMQGERDGRQVDIKIGDLPPCHADPNLLRQVFINLIGNAHKFTRKRDPGVIEIGSRPGDVAGEVVYFIKDNGAGFDMRYADRLFGVFQRLHTQDEFEGTGVGLAIVQRVIHRHGGRIWAEAEVDKGAAFYFALGGNDLHE